MSRRKQSNPKPLIKVDEDGGKEPQTHSSGNGDDRGDQQQLQEGESGEGVVVSVGAGGSPRSNHSGSGTGSCDLGKGIRIRSNRELTNENPNGEGDGEGEDVDNDNESDTQEGSRDRSRSRSRSGAKRQRLRQNPAPDDELSQGEDSQDPPPQHATPVSVQQMLAGFPYLQHMNFAMRNDLKLGPLSQDAARLFFMPSELIPSTVPGAAEAMSLNSNGGAARSGSGRASKSSGGSSDGKGASVAASATADLSPRTGPVYMCEPCNIKFSSANTLEAHQTFYCSFRKDSDKNGAKSEKGAEFDPPTPQNKSQAHGAGVKRSASIVGVDIGGDSCHSDMEDEQPDDDEHELSIDESRPHSPNSAQIQAQIQTLMHKQEIESDADPDAGNPNKSLKTGKQYACMYCSYSAEKKVSLNRHMRMHSGGGPSQSQSMSVATVGASMNEDSRSCSTPFNVGAGASSSKSQEPGPSSQGTGGGIVAMECYCTDCDIQFSKVKTYRVHKQYYCSTRHVLKGQAIGALPAGSGGGGGSGDAPSPLPPPAGSPAGGLHSSAGHRQPSSRNSPSASCSPPTGISSIGAGGGPPSTPFLLLPTNPVIIVPYCFIQAATLLPGNMLPSQNALVVLPNGIVQGLPNTLVLPPPPSSTTPGPSGSSTSPNINSSQQFAAGLNLPQSCCLFDDPKEVIKRMSTVAGGDRSRKRNHVSSAESAKDSSDGRHQRMRERDPMDLTLRPGSADDGCVGVKGGSGSMSSLSSGSRSSSHVQLHHPDANDHEILEHEHDRDQSRSPDRCLNSMPMSSLASIKRSASVHSSRPSSASVSSTCSTSPPAPALLQHQHQHASESATKSGLPPNGLKLERLSPSSFSQLSESQQQLLLYQHQIQQQQVAAAKMMQSTSRNTHSHGQSRSKSGSGSGSNPSIATTFPGGAVLTATHSGSSATSPAPSLADLLMATAAANNANVDLSDNLSKLNSQLLSGSSAAATAMMAAAAASLPPELAIRLLSDPNYLSSIQQTIAQAQQQQQQNMGLMVPTTIGAGVGVNHSSPAKAAPSPAPAPPPPVKRGVSRCVECDIVFYKYENYLVHKEHYCAARGNSNPPSASAGSGSGLVNGSASELKDPLHISPPPQLPPPASRQRRSHAGAGGARHQPQPQPQQSPSIGTRARNNNKMAMAAGLTAAEEAAMLMQMQMQSQSPGGGDNSGDGMTTMKTVSGSPPVSAGVSLRGVTITPTSVPQYACLHCGVKFSSLDTLKTHQTFYCPNSAGKRPPPPILDTVEGEDELEINESVQQQQQQQHPKTNSKGLPPGSSAANATMLVNEKSGVVTCSKCKLVIPEDQLSVHGAMCTQSANSPSSISAVAAGGSPGWKCPCCETYSPTMSSAQKHLETHSGLRAFKCVLCGYRGNTIRGMRTHIRMHFDKRVSNDLHEADYITCITSKDLDPPAPSGAGHGHSHQTQNHAPAPVLSNASATAAVHGALKLTNANANSNSNAPSQKSSPSTSPLLTVTGTTTTTNANAKNVNNNDSPAEDGGGVVLPGGGNHVTTTKATMLYVT